MKQKLLFILGCYYLYTNQLHQLFAEGEGGRGAVTGLLQGVKSSEDKSASERIRTGDLHLDDIPNVINGLINIFIGMAGTIAVIFVIIGAYKLLFGSLKQDHTKGRETIIMALTGFAISVLAWFIVQFIFDNFTG